MVQVGIKLKPDKSQLNLTYINFEFVNMADIYFEEETNPHLCKQRGAHPAVQSAKVWVQYPAKPIALSEKLTAAPQNVGY